MKNNLNSYFQSRWKDKPLLGKLLHLFRQVVPALSLTRAAWWQLRAHAPLGTRMGTRNLFPSPAAQEGEEWPLSTSPEVQGCPGLCSTAGKAAERLAAPNHPPFPNSRGCKETQVSAGGAQSHTRGTSQPGIVSNAYSFHK